MGDPPSSRHQFVLRHIRKIFRKVFAHTTHKSIMRDTRFSFRHEDHAFLASLLWETEAEKIKTGPKRQSVAVAKSGVTILVTPPVAKTGRGHSDSDASMDSLKPAESN